VGGGNRGGQDAVPTDGYYVVWIWIPTVCGCPLTVADSGTLGYGRLVFEKKSTGLIRRGCTQPTLRNELVGYGEPRGSLLSSSKPGNVLPRGRFSVLIGAVSDAQGLGPTLSVGHCLIKA